MRAAALAVLALALCACATPPGEIARMRAENELLKAEIEVIKRNCSYYRELDLEAEEPD